MKDETIIIIAIAVILALFYIFSRRKEGYIRGRNYDFSKNDLHPCAANCGATPWSVVPPAWIGQFDQGNGRIGDDTMSGYVFYNAL